VEKVIEYGSRLAGHQDRLSTHFGEIADLVREASFWAGYHGRELVQAGDVQAALRERIYRANRLEERLRENIADRLIFIDTSGTKVGQVNGLSVLDLGDYTFGQPGRITARVYLGEDGVVNIEREVDMAGPIHNKGLLTLVGYLGGQYAQQTPLSLSASLTFEQNYGGVDGDSASAAELFALLSVLGDTPLRQDIAVTGSINQRGDIQPVGGVTEKIEGFFRVCRDGGLTGTQGVLIPVANIRHLMLDEEVVAAVAAGKFHVWGIETVDEGITLLTGRDAGERDAEGHFPEGTIHHAVQERLHDMAIRLKTFTEDEDHDD
jgi:predicted ATP-dependent protease